MADNMVRYKDILEAYYDCRKKKRRKKAALEFETDYEQRCLDITDEINAKTYVLSPSDAFIVTDQKVREVFAANFRDRVVHHWLTIRLEPLFEELLIDKLFSCRKGKGTSYGIDCLQEDIRRVSNNYSKIVYVGKFDLKGFFTSIKKDILKEKIIRLINERYENKEDKENLLWIAEKIISNDPTKNCILKSPKEKWKPIINTRSLFTCKNLTGIEVGNKPSQLFANYYLNKFDHMVSKEFDGAYGRYVDDFYVVSESKKKIVDYVPFMREWLSSSLGLTLHPDKTYIQPYYYGVKFTGTVVKGDMKYVGNRTVHRAFRLVDDMNARPWVYNGPNLERTVCKLNSYLGFMRHKDSYDIRKRLIRQLHLHWRQTLFIKKGYAAVNIRKQKKDASKITGCKTIDTSKQMSKLTPNSYWKKCIDALLNGQSTTGIHLASQ